MTREITDEAAAEIAGADQDFTDVVQRLPLGKDEHLPPNWLRVEALERYQVLGHAGIEHGMNVLEVGCGAHAISTVALAHRVGDRGRVVAVEKERWTYFHEIVRASGLARRVIPQACDATVTGNQVTGRGPLDDQQQFGIAMGAGAVPLEISGNVISNHIFTGMCIPVMCMGAGLLVLFFPAETIRDVELWRKTNTFVNNDVDIMLFASEAALVIL